MKRISILFSLLVVLSIQYSCKQASILDAGFKDMQKLTIYDYLVQNETDYSSFLQILKAGGLDKTLSFYNPNGIDYTLFVPDNKAIDDFIKQSSQYSSLDELFKDQAFCKALAMYHVVNMGVRTQDFPFGAFPEPTLSGDYLNVNFIIAADTTYYKINNQAPVIKTNIKLSNGYIHVIGVLLIPVTLNSYKWLKNHKGFSIITAAIEATGMNNIIDVDMKLKDQPLKPFTMLIEPDSIYKKRNINSFADLARTISPDSPDYTNNNNPLNLFVGYHFLTQAKFLNDLSVDNTNYNTFADIPLTINGLGIDILINKGKENFGVKIANGDTTIIDFIKLYYDESNVVTQSGNIHFIDQILNPQVPSRQTVTFQFGEETKLNEYRIKGGTYLMESSKSLDYVTWTGADLFYVKSNDVSEQASNRDYLQIDGDFTITYQIPKVIQGKYRVLLQADASGSQNAVVELIIDGNILGGPIDLTKGGNKDDTYALIKVGDIDFKKYANHSIEVISMIPGRFKWDYIRFEPI
jgi:uncharacterized surface protein with fasciclin (FAS1) repeats